MQPVAAVIVGIIVGGIVNMSLVVLSEHVIPLPEGVNPADVESLKENMHLFEARHFIFPLLAHALGTLVGAALAARIAPTLKMRYAFIVGAFYQLGGIANVLVLPAPLWFVAVDLVGCYIPMAWIGGKIFARNETEESQCRD